MISRKALALLNTIIFVIVFSILAGALLMSVSSQIRSMESSIQRLKAFYAAEAGLVHAIDTLQRDDSLHVDDDSPLMVEWSYTTADPPVTLQFQDVEIVSMPQGIYTQINTSVEYTFPW